MTGQRAVLVAAAGAAWEALALQELDADPSLVLARRCLDVAELVAVVPSSGATAAVVDLDLPGLDAVAVDDLARAGVLVVGVGDPDRCAALGIAVRGEPGRLAASLAGAGEALPAAAPHADRGPDGRLVVVWGPAGAPGRSTVALGLADACSRAGRSTVLVDADTYGGAQAQMLGLLDEVSGLLTACRAANHGRLDDVAAHLAPVHDGLAVLTGLPRADMWPHVRRAPLERVVDALVAEHDVVVADTGFGLEPPERGTSGRDVATTHLLAAADDVVVVGRADPVGLARLVRGLHDLRDAGVRSPHVVLNRVRGGLGWSERELSGTVARLAGTEPAALLPDDAATLDAAVVRGRVPHAASATSPLVRSLDGLAGSLAARW